MNARDTGPLTTQPLKIGLHRRVFVETDADGVRQVVKRFEGRGLLKRLGDRSRARREFDLLASLHAAGVPVPSPGELRKREGAWEFSCGYVDGAVSLEELLERTERELHPGRLCRALGQTLAAAHALGLDHDDLHAGNVLFDSAGRAVLVDFGGARRRTDLGASHLVRDLVSLAAATRERTPSSMRQRVLLAWRRALPSRLSRGLAPLPELAIQIEREAVRRRARVVREHADRWLRESGRCRRLDRETLVARHLGTEEARDLVTGLGRAEPAGVRAPHHANPAFEVLMFRGGEELRQGWVHLGRALEHALPALRPLVLHGGRSFRAALEAPRGTIPVTRGQEDPRALAALRASLRDRALAIDAATPLWRTPADQLLLGPRARLRVEDLDG